MKNLKIKAPNTILHDKELKLYDFIEDFVEIESKAFLKIDKSKCKSKSVTRLSKKKMVKSFLKNIINIALNVLLKILLKMDILHVNYIF